MKSSWLIHGILYGIAIWEECDTREQAMARLDAIAAGANDFLSANPCVRNMPEPPLKISTDGMRIEFTYDIVVPVCIIGSHQNIASAEGRA